MKTLTKLCVFLLGLLMFSAVFGIALATQSQISPGRLMSPRMITEAIHGSSVTSGNWGGYAVTGPAGSVTYAAGSWIVPAVPTTSSTTFAACWVGIDGFSSNTVEQTGTISMTGDYAAYGFASPYIAWYEFYPYQAIVPITSMTISSGNVMYATVTYTTSPNEFTLYLDDVTTGVSYSTTELVSSLGYTPARSCAEWIIEAPSSGNRVLPLANFGTALYGSDNTAVSSPATCYATISGTADPIGSLTAIAGTTTYAITMADGGAYATPSALSTDGTSFSMTYSTSAPAPTPTPVPTATPTPTATPKPTATPPPHHHGF